ncbi:MAG TPA: DUF58 domain-containing protein [Frankiaceae bacterium]|jgi:uncharacterized protein (DUF58 family)|nr:DUF58 domain-containing protein [Frankiaceae bacterium]
MTTPHVGRLTTFVALALLTATIAGRVEVAVLGVAAAAVLGASLRREAPSVTTEVLVSDERVYEGDELDLTIRLRATGDADSVTVRLSAHPALRVRHRDATVTVPLRDGETRDVVLKAVASRWGVLSAGPAYVVAYGRGRTHAEAVVAPAQVVRVLPRREEFDASAAHPHTRALAGSHPARVAGEGIEPTGVREYRPGDAFRRVNWRVTARRRAMHVTEQVPERNAEVVLFLDTYVDRGPEGATTLDLAVRAGAAIAEHYLASMDRVGAVSFGGVLSWLYADAGRVQQHRVVEHLIGTATVKTYADKDVAFLPARSLPPRALVIALSPLLDTRAAGAIADLAHRGYGLVVVDTSPRPLLPPPTRWARDLAQRLFLVERDALVHRLAEVGVPVVPWTGAGSLNVVLAEVTRLHARPRVAMR